MDTQESINLLSSQTKLPDVSSRFLETMKKGEVIGLVLFLVIGSIVAGMYFFIRSLTERSAVKEQELTRIVSSFSQSEGLLVTIQERSRILEKLLATQANWAEVFENIGVVVPQSAFISVAVDGKKNVVMTVKTDTLEELFPILTSLISDVQAKKILSLKIVSFQMDKDGVSRVAVSFYPVL